MKAARRESLRTAAAATGMDAEAVREQLADCLEQIGETRYWSRRLKRMVREWLEVLEALDG